VVHKCHEMLRSTRCSAVHAIFLAPLTGKIYLSLNRVNSVCTQRITAISVKYRSHRLVLDASTAAKFLSVNRRTLLIMARKGRVRAYPLIAGRQRTAWRFRLTELAADISAGAKHTVSGVNTSEVAGTQNATSGKIAPGSPLAFSAKRRR
jgi:hypothetical protein